MMSSDFAVRGGVSVSCGSACWRLAACFCERVRISLVGLGGKKITSSKASSSLIRSGSPSNVLSSWCLVNGGS